MKTALDLYYRLLQVLLALLVAALVVPVTMQVLSRYTGLIPRFIWTEEIARFCFIWIIMIGAMIAVRDGTHFDLDLWPRSRNPKIEAGLRILVNLVIGLVAVIFLRWGWDFALLGARQTSEIAELPMLLIYIAWPLAGLTWALFLAEKIVADARILLGRGDPA